MTASIQQADIGNQPEGAATSYEVDWGDVHISFRLQPSRQFGELVLSRQRAGNDTEVHAAIIPVGFDAINGIGTPPPSVYVDGVKFVPAPPEEEE